MKRKAELAEAFHDQNPEFYKRFESLALAAWRAGRKRTGAFMIFNVIRWEQHISTDDDASEWKVNNNYAPWYAREFLRQHPECDGLFELRRADADEVAA